MSNKYRELLPEARELEKHINTDWTDENLDRYDNFADIIEHEWSKGNLTDAEFNSLAGIAFYDYPEGLKGEEFDRTLEQPISKYHITGGRYHGRYQG